MGLILAIDTATPQVSVALAGPDGLLAQFQLGVGRRHGETLTPAIQCLLSLTGTGLEDVDQVAIDVGPGLFTGLRVGIATAKALGAALGRPLAPCSSLDVLAHALAGMGRPLAAVVDARRGEVFWSLYEPAGYEPAGRRMVAVTEPVVAPPEKAGEHFGDELLLVGDGARRYFGDRALSGPAFDFPSAAVLAELAAGTEPVPVEAVSPVYIRDADVRIGWEQR